jgi:hypothetical protein
MSNVGIFSQESILVAYLNRTGLRDNERNVRSE